MLTTHSLVIHVIIVHLRTSLAPPSQIRTNKDLSGEDRVTRLCSYSETGGAVRVYSVFDCMQPLAAVFPLLSHTPPCPLPNLIERNGHWTRLAVMFCDVGTHDLRPSAFIVRVGPKIGELAQARQVPMYAEIRRVSSTSPLSQNNRHSLARTCDSLENAWLSQQVQAGSCSDFILTMPYDALWSSAG